MILKQFLLTIVTFQASLYCMEVTQFSKSYDILDTQDILIGSDDLPPASKKLKIADFQSDQYNTFEPEASQLSNRPLPVIPGDIQQWEPWDDDINYDPADTSYALFVQTPTLLTVQQTLSSSESIDNLPHIPAQSLLPENIQEQSTGDAPQLDKLSSLVIAEKKSYKSKIRMKRDYIRNQFIVFCPFFSCKEKVSRQNRGAAKVLMRLHLRNDHALPEDEIKKLLPYKIKVNNDDQAF